MSAKKNIDMDKAIDMKANGKTLSQIAKALNCGVRTLSQRFQDINDVEISNESDEDIIKVNVTLAKQKQRLADLNRISNKAFRDNARIENSTVELYQEYVKVLNNHKLPKKIFKLDKIKSSKKVGGILQLSDLHLNELVDIISNKYDFEIASQRIRKFVNDARIYFQAKGVKDICICMTGDLMNSDRRLDELLSQATNRAKALFLSVMIIEQAILDLQQDFNVSVLSVIGNESRITKDIGWVEDVATDNYDFMIHNTLKLLFRESNVNFFEDCGTEQIIEIVGLNILVLHGNQIKGSKMEQSIQKIIGKYASQGIIIHYVISGHLHSTRNADTFSRSSSMVGSNEYSWSALQLISKASQNIYMFHCNGNIDSIKIDLQHVDKIEGYPIIKALESYNAKSVKKAKKKVVIQRLVV